MPKQKTIRLLRVKAGWTQHELAVSLDVTLIAIYNWERGKYESRASNYEQLLTFSASRWTTSNLSNSSRKQKSTA
ncbi:hypothetical protein BH09CHL1_BH09CHL1_29680 [soil metagenome]